MARNEKEEMLVATVKCTGCGAENALGTAYCATCARKLDSTTSDQIERTRADALTHAATATRWVAVLVAVVGLLIVLAIMLVVITHIGTILTY